ncbi:nitronate monooxygenase [Diaphorobacter ruginosibacter]|uniref:NAD(P)H-dependent flavin oxidoreductase n=1 Tax=Diaphorobacter ruginosibacter TaxID=1715720 RepID=UPI003340C354
MTTPSLFARLGIEHPIIQGPMTGSDTPALAAAVSSAGALGMLGCGMRSPTAMKEAAEAVRAATDRPFGMNLFVLKTPSPDPSAVQKAMARLEPLYAEFGLQPAIPAQWCENFEAQFEMLLALRPPVASFTFGILTRNQTERLHAAGIPVIGTATTVAEAEAWEIVGADAVCVSGMEAGGHRGTFLGDFQASMIGTLPLVAECTRRLSVPVIAAGGIMDGRGIAAAQALGAAAVQMGTAFLVCPESGIGAAYREALAGASACDTRCTRIFSGRPSRGIVNTMMEKLAGFEQDVPEYPVQNALTGALRRAAGAQGRADYLSLWAGQGVALARAIPAGELVATLVRERSAAAA